MCVKKKKSPLVKLLIALIVIVAFVIVLLSGIKIGEKIAFSSFYSKAKREFEIPGSKSGFVAQGLDYVEENEVFLTCGYSAKKGEASMVYTIDKDGNAVCTLLKKENGKNYTGHTGGIAHYKNYVYITGADGCDVFALSDFISGNGEAKKLGEIKSPEGHDPAFVTIHGGKLHEGSFYRAGNYETPQNERITTPCGDKNTSLIYAYNLDDTKPFGVDQTPVSAYSARGLVQGIAFADNRAVLSCSWGLSTSHLCYYDLDKVAAMQEKVNGATVYPLDSASLIKDVSAPPMSEEIVFKDGRLYIMTESASNKYIFGKFMSGYHLYSYAD